MLGIDPHRSLRKNKVYDVLKSRLAADEKYVRRIAKRVAQLAKGLSDKERDAASLLLETDLNLFHQHIERLYASTKSTTALEIQTYEDKTNLLQERCEQEKSLIGELKAELEQAQLVRAQKLEYNDIARKILVYPRPEAMDAKLQGLKERIQMLKQEVEHYDQANTSAKSGLQDVSATLNALHSSVRASLGYKVQEKETEESAGAQAAASPSASAPSHNTEEPASSKQSQDEVQGEPSDAAASSGPPSKRPKRSRSPETASTAP
ncbi:hypothetical protein MNAN1_002906 [Malassezia nana]|uniref:THO complex subunit 7 n=1 Tax=Malassezia nana TaxID=180528 RepID=A0AAF0EM69_9BASI|nr:hypothetical protein MNAN1_002906 [Malassezia nana]